MTRDDERVRPVVVKVGGSLLDLHDLPCRLERLLHKLTPSPTALVGGGGEAANVVRDWDRRFAFTASVSHWLAIDAMRLTESLLVEILPGSWIADSWGQLETIWREGGTAILSAGPLLRQAEASGEASLPHSWEVTSDSIAAWAAGRLGARLLLAKSVDAPSSKVDEAAAAGLVDRWFARAIAGTVSVDWVNLRADDIHIETWLSPTADK